MEEILFYIKFFVLQLVKFFVSKIEPSDEFESLPRSKNPGRNYILNTSAPLFCKHVS